MAKNSSRVHYFYLINLISLFIFDCLGLELYEGSNCKNVENDDGVCRLITDCPIGIKQIRSHRKHNLTRCGFDHYTEIVCCPLDDGQTVSPRYTTRKSVQVCDKYLNRTQVIITYHIIGGQDAVLGEFPHMAALGYNNSQTGEMSFDCGGSLISEYYVLTAAHCIANIRNNPPVIVRLGVLNVFNISDPVNRLKGHDYKIKNISINSKYSPRFKLNDIALILLEEEVQFNTYIYPACLYSKNKDPSQLIITGWGYISLNTSRKDILQKADIYSVPLNQCNDTLTKVTSTRYVLNTQVCAIGNESDTCMGDSGGPLQIENPGKTTTYSIVGVTSFGIVCGSEYPAVYTRVSSYLDWIENIVWPS